jgi:hypothetical protein
MIIIIAVVLACISLVAFALALLAEVLEWIQLEEILFHSSLVLASISLILMIVGVFILIILDLLNFI